MVLSTLMLASQETVGALVMPSGVQLNLPLRQPTSNIFAAPMNIGVGKIQYSIYVVKEQMTSATGSVVKFPTSTCEYFLSKYKSIIGPYVSVKRLGFNNFSIKMAYQSHSINLLPHLKKIYVDGVSQAGDFNATLIPEKFTATYAGKVLSAKTEQVSWTAHVSTQENEITSMSAANMSGIGWLTYTDNMNNMDLLIKMDPFKVNPRCAP